MDEISTKYKKIIRENSYFLLPHISETAEFDENIEVQIVKIEDDSLFPCSAFFNFQENKIEAWAVKAYPNIIKAEPIIVIRTLATEETNFSISFLLEAFLEIFGARYAHVSFRKSYLENLYVSDSLKLPNTFESHIYFDECNILSATINGLSEVLEFSNCNITCLTLGQDTINFYHTWETEIRFLEVHKSVNTLSLERLTLNLIQFSSTISIESQFSECSIHFQVDDFNQRQFGKLDTKSLLNTYHHLYQHSDLKSHRLTLYRYTTFFNTRNHLIKKILFFYTEGYYLIFRPLTGFITAYSIVVISTYKLTGDLGKSIHYTLFSPTKVFTEVILQHLSINNEFSFLKIQILLWLPFLIYSLFALITAIKRRFGFGKL